MEQRGNFGSKLGIVLATAGSAVGLGNIWRFPYMTGQNGGAAFLLMYIACIMLLGVPGMISEFIVGRHAQSNAARAYDKLSGGRPWKLVGYLGILTSTIILGFYAVVAGWCLQYLYASIAGQVQGDSQYVQQYFVSFSSNAWKPVVCGLLFVVMTHLIVVRGVRKGIEKASKWLMPILLVLLVVLVIASCSLPGAIEGVKFLLQPDFSKINSHVMLEALGQAFFSLSLGTACLCTYASYFSHIAVAGNSLPVYLCQLLLQNNQSAALSRPDSLARHADSHPLRTAHLPCRSIRGYWCRLRTFPDLYHAAQRVPTSFWQCACSRLCGQHHVLCPTGLCCADLDHLDARDRNSLL